MILDIFALGKVIAPNFVYYIKLEGFYSIIMKLKFNYTLAIAAHSEFQKINLISSSNFYYDLNNFLF